MRSAVTYILLGALAYSCLASGEFDVNIRSSLNQANPAIAADSNGNFVVVWHSYYQSKSNEIRARLFDSDGSAVSGELAINQTEGGNQKAPAVVMDAAGNFTVVWQGPGDDGDDIWCRRFDANGVAQTNEFIVNSNRVDEQVSCDIALNGSGLHIIVWESNGVPEAGAKAICGQLFDADGNEVGDELILSDGNDIYRFPAIALSNDANAVVVWVKDSATQEVYRRQFFADGNAPPYGSFKVNVSPNLNSLTYPAIAMDSAGNYIIAWDGHPSDHDEDDIYLRPFHFSGAWGDQYKIDDGNDGAQRNPTVVLYDGGEFILLWQGDSEKEQNSSDIYGQRFVMDFEEETEPEKIGDEFLMNTYVYEEQRNTATCGRGDGKYVAVWQSQGQDGSEKGIFGGLGPLTGTADLDGDGFVDFFDYCLISGEWAQQGSDLTGDLINNNAVDGEDIGAFGEQWLSYRYSCADVNVAGGSGIDLRDFAVLARDWGRYGPVDGDIDGNGVVDIRDLQWLLLHWCRSCE